MVSYQSAIILLFAAFVSYSYALPANLYQTRTNQAQEQNWLNNIYKGFRLTPGSQEKEKVLEQTWLRYLTSKNYCIHALLPTWLYIESNYPYTHAVPRENQLIGQIQQRFTEPNDLIRSFLGNN